MLANTIEKMLGAKGYLPATNEQGEVTQDGYVLETRGEQLLVFYRRPEPTPRDHAAYLAHHELAAQRARAWMHLIRPRMDAKYLVMYHETERHACAAAGPHVHIRRR